MVVSSRKKCRLVEGWDWLFVKEVVDWSLHCEYLEYNEVIDMWRLSGRLGWVLWRPIQQWWLVNDWVQE